MYKVKRFSVYDGNGYWEELAGRKLPDQFNKLTKIEAKYPRFKEVNSDGVIPTTPGKYKLDIFNDDLLSEDEKCIILLSSPDGSGDFLEWYYDTDTYKWGNRKSNLLFNSIKEALISYLSNLVKIFTDDVNSIKSRIDKGEKYTRKLVFWSKRTLEDELMESLDKLDLYSDYLKYIKNNLK